MKNLKWEYFAQIFDPDFIEKYISSIINAQTMKPEISEFEGVSIDYVYENLGVDFIFNEDYDLESIFFHLNNQDDGYESFQNPPFDVNKHLKRNDLHEIFGVPDTVDEGIPDIGLNSFDIYNKGKYNLSFEYTDTWTIKTMSIETKFNRK